LDLFIDLDHVPLFPLGLITWCGRKALDKQLRILLNSAIYVYHAVMFLTYPIMCEN